VIDLHCHVLPGIDDGPSTIEGSVELARAAHAEGIHTLVATPHVSARYPKNEPDAIARLVGQLGARLREEQIELEVLPGAEIAIMHLPALDPAALERLSLGNSDWLLVEPPFAPVAPGLDRLLLDLLERDHKLVLAHPERCPIFHRDRGMLESLADAGVLLSITAGSLIGRFGGEVRRFALALARDGLIDNVTSDAHDCEQRAPGLASELREAGLAPLAGWLTQEVPGAILDGLEIPPRPAVERALARPRWHTWRARW
jgi:protein-tyrosine phosphatase